MTVTALYKASNLFNRSRLRAVIGVWMYTYIVFPSVFVLSWIGRSLTMGQSPSKETYLLFIIFIVP
jgi:hypothetical protein